MRHERNNKNAKITSSCGRVLLLALIAVAAVCAASTVAFAGEVTYEGQAGGFVLSPGSSSSPTDLFSNFNDVVPGDTLTDTVDVRNNSKETVNIYMRALGATNGSSDFLSQINLEVSQRDGGKLFSAPADRKTGLEDWVLLGTMAPGAKATLDLSINVPIEMSNDYQDAMGQLGWQFKVEELEEPTTGIDGPTTGPDESATGTEDQTKGPNEPTTGSDDSGGHKTRTGDISPIRIFIAIMIAAAAVVIIILMRRRDKKNGQ